MTRSVPLYAVMLCLAAVAGGVLYHFQVAGALEKRLREEQEARRAVQKDYDGFRAGLLRQAVEALEKNAAIVAGAMRRREEQQNEVRREGKNVLANIAVQSAVPGEANIDLPLPRALSAGLAGLHRAAANAGGDPCAEGNAAAGGNLFGKTCALSPGNADAPIAGRLDGGTADLDR